MPHRATNVVEVRALNSARDSGEAHVVYRDGDAGLTVRILPAEPGRAVIGRRVQNDIPVMTDGLVSRSHAVLERVGDEWTVADGGMSTNGTQVNGKPVSGRHRLRDKDVIRVGHIDILFRTPRGEESITTALDADVRRRNELLDSLTRRELAVLVALCRPIDAISGEGSPAQNTAIADEVHMEVATVKLHLRDLYRKFGISALAQNEKRLRLAQLALRWGAVASRDASAP